MKHFFSWMRGCTLAALLIHLWLAGPAARAQAPAWQTVIAANQNRGDYSTIKATVTDASGNVYLVGDFGGTVHFDSITLVCSGGDTDIFIAKWSPITGFVWAKRAGGNSLDYAEAVAINGTDIYVAGTFASNTADFGSSILTNANATTTPVGDMFVTKLTDAGTSANFIWSLRAGGPYDDGATGIAVNGASIYVVGSFSDTANFGSVVLTSAGRNDAFVAKLVDAGPNGSFSWVQRAGGPSFERLNAVAINGTSIYVTGTFSSALADFGSSILNSIGSYYDVFITKLTDAGTTSSFTWTKQAGGTGWDEAFDIAVNGANVYVVGEFSGTSATFGNTTVTNTGNSVTYDAFVTKIIDSGSTSNFSWTQQAGGPLNDQVYAMAVHGSSLYLTGGFGGPTALFGSTMLTNASGTLNPSHDIFTAKLLDTGTSGNFAWVQQAGSSIADEAYALAVSGATIYVGGTVASPASFSSITVNSPNLYRVAFLASLTDPTLIATTAAQGSLPFTLAPNPARAATTLTLPAMPGAPTATLTLTDALGRTLHTTTVALPAAGLRHPLDLSGLAPGLYAVQVRAGSTTSTQRLVVE
ncbi:T9SS type A sorting domain-containing protein [Hymenobacter negativus]|uniref:T9SS type A sorting domain-containing protein n=1 Tax=Hymenobacter negativus TaxID=2795026 RepID=A0ABS3QGM9_9BACT|nr:T9SS type A sorting domain-containing protein [Hymenobacter negativus]MBO2010266.1 T9SS type A sorting domain-containing protein [Hymenobacter negativus]